MNKYIIIFFFIIYIIYIYILIKLYEEYLWFILNLKKNIIDFNN